MALRPTMTLVPGNDAVACAKAIAVSAAPDRDRDAAADAELELAQLQEQIEATRAVLAGLQQDVVAAQAQLDGDLTDQLVEVNAHLLSAALDARTEAETAAQALDDASRASGLDVLTHLPNRLLLLDRFAHAIANAKRHGTGLALLFLDLDNFKQINDSLGHAVGDQALQRAAHCLSSAVREIDTVSRHGGDEFLILLDEVAESSDAVVVAEKVIAALGIPVQLGGQEVQLTGSIGISIYPNDGEDAETLIDRADAAMYLAKKHGLRNFLFHGEEPVGSGRNPTLSSYPSPPPPPSPQGLALAEHERRHAQLQEANGQLVMAALGAQDLQVAAEQGQQRQTAFLAMLAHELRNPLAPIRTAAALLGRASADETMLPRLQAVIERQVVHMSRLIGDLMDISRVSTGKLRLQRQSVEMAAVIAEAIDACRPAMDVRLQHFDVAVPARLLEVHGDPVRLTQVLSNLLDNASKYTPDGGRIALSVAVLDGNVVVTVSDNGIGITADALPHVFDPFVQDAHATDFNGIGLGIGLTVVRELVEAHGGSVVAKSAGSGRGSEFVVSLPLLGPALES